MIVVLEPDPTVRDDLSTVLSTHDDVAEVTHVDHLEDDLLALRDPIGAVFVGPGVDEQLALKVADRVHALDPGVGVVLVARRVTRNLLREAMRAGASDVVAASADEAELLEASGRARAQTVQWRATQPVVEEPVVARCPMTVVFSTKGGSGKSFVATNLAILLRESLGSDVGLVDLDLESGDLAIMLQVLPAWTIHEAVEQVARLDVDALRQFMTPHRSGVQLLAAPTEPAFAEDVHAEAVGSLLEMARTMYHHVVVDCPAAFTEVVLTALDAADDVVLVASLDVPSIKNLKLALSTLARLGIGRGRIQVVLNRADSNVGLRLREVEKVIGTSIDVSIPSSRDVPLSVNEGVPLATRSKRSPVTRALGTLRDRIVSTPPTTPVEASPARTWR